MDLASVANGESNNISDAGVSQAVAISILKKSMDMDQENAKELMKAIPKLPTTSNLPPHLGNNVDTIA